MPCSTLVVIDMQPSFSSASEPRVVSGVTREIIYSKMKDEPVVFVEFVDCLPTYTSLLNLLKGYRKRSRIRKNDDDGSDEIINCLNRRGYHTDHLKVCGVNADCCVYDTVEGLLKKLPNTKIEVVKDACGWSHANPAWNRYIKHPNLSLV